MKETATKASTMLGLHPITDKAIKKHLKTTNDARKAREMAIRDFLKEFLQFNDDELEKVKINDSKVSSKGDDTVYAAFRDIDTIREIHWRVGEIRNQDIIVRNFIPPQFWERYMFLNRACKEYRDEYPEMKTQLRFGCKDVEVMLKRKGSKEAYRKVAFSEITDPREVPLFDHQVKWTQRHDKPLRRKLRVVETQREEDSLKQLLTRNKSVEGVSLTRFRSTESTKTGGKKQKTGDITDEAGMETE